MSVLTSLLARDRIVPVSRIEEALERQVLEGGDVETVLLEMGLVPEDTLSAYRAALFGLLPATREEVMKASREAVRLLPRDLARMAGLVPLVYEGRSLVLAAAEPPPAAVRGQLTRGLSCELSVRIVTPPRLLGALSQHYGFELEPRMRKLLEALRKRDPGAVPYVRPPGPSLRPSRAPNAFEPPPDTLQYPVLPKIIPEAALTPAGLALSEPGAPDPAASAELEVPIIPKAPKPPSEAGLALTRLSSIPPSTVSGHVVRTTRGPIPIERARELLLQVPQRDDVLYVLLRYAQQFFDFVGVFSVGKEGARGRLASGSRLSPELVEHVVFPLEGNGLVARAVRDKRPLVGDASSTDEERAALSLLARPAGRPALVMPIVLGPRVVLLMYADREAEGIALQDAEPLTALLPAVGEALRRIIVEQKALRRSITPPGHAPAERGAEEPIRAESAPSEVTVLSAPDVVGPQRSDSPERNDEERVPSADSMPAAGPAPIEEMQAVPEPLAQELEAVDLDRVSSGTPFERRREARRDAGAVTPINPEARDAARGRLMGIPRTAPPPPSRESFSPGGRTAGGYSFVSPSGTVAEEDLRPAAKPGPGPLGMRDAAVAPVNGAALAQIKPIQVERPRSGEGSERNAEREIAERAAPAAQAQDDEGATNANEREALARNSITQLAENARTSVIIDMGDQITALIDQLLRASPGEDGPTIDALLRVGEVALPVLMQFFPGPLWFDRRKPHKRRPRGRDVSAVARAVVAYGDRSAPYLASRLTGDDVDVCFYALMVAAEIPHVDLLDGVARRALDADDAIRAVALDALRAFVAIPQIEAVIKAFAQLSERPGKDPRRQRLSVEALSELRDPRTLAALLPRLSDGSDAIVQAAHRGLVLLTAQDFGLAQRKWESWVEQSSRTHRVEWLIESLMHADESMRTLAGEEIKQLTQQYFGYHPQLPKRDRELSQRKYREWWESEGRAVFQA